MPKIKGRSFHSFRRSLTTYLLEKGNLKEAADYMKDKIETLLRYYVKPTDEARKRANDMAAERIDGKQDSGDGRSVDYTATEQEREEKESA